MLSIGRQLFVNELAGTVFGPASTVFYDTLLSFLERGQKVLLWLGLIITAAGWFSGTNSTGTATRHTVAGGLESVGSVLADGPVAGAGRWVAANARWLRIVVGLLGFVVLLWGFDVSPSRLAWSTALVVVLLAVVQVLVGAGGQPTSTDTPETPEAPPAPPAAAGTI